MKKQNGSEIKSVALTTGGEAASGDAVSESAVVQAVDGAEQQDVEINQVELTNGGDAAQETMMNSELNNDADVPAAVVSGTESVVTDANQADNLATLVGETAATVAVEPVTTDTVESASDESVSTDSVAPESERPLTGEEIQETQETDDATPQAVIADIMKDPVIKDVAQHVKAEMSRANASLLNVAFQLARTDGKLSDKSYRYFALNVLDMEVKYAYDLRAVGKRFKPFVDRRTLTVDYLGTTLKISRLITLTRYADSEWCVKDGHIMVSRMDDKKVPQESKTAESMSVEDLRVNLQNLKATLPASKSSIEMALDLYERAGLRCDILASVGSDKQNLLEEIKAWDAQLKSQSEKNEEKRMALKAAIADAETASLSLGHKRGRAKFWIDLLTGQDNDLPEEWQSHILTKQEEAARLDRQQRVLAVRNPNAPRV